MVKKSSPGPRSKKMNNTLPTASKQPARLATPPVPVGDGPASAKKRAGSPKKAEPLGIKKEFLKALDVCKVTFRLPHAAIMGGKRVCLVGDFNEWSTQANPMRKLRNGDFFITLNLKAGRSYHYRYLIDENRWENDWKADRYEKNPYGDSDNSVVDVYKP